MNDEYKVSILLLSVVSQRYNGRRRRKPTKQRGHRMSSSSSPCSYNDDPMDIAILIDNTGGLTEEQCGVQLNNIADLMENIKENNKHARIALVEVNGDDCKLLVSLDSNMNEYLSHYLQYIKTLECKNGFGQTKLGCGLLTATEELTNNGNTNAQKKIISINNCIGNDAKCSRIANTMDSSGINKDDIIFINAIGGICGSQYGDSNIIRSPDTYASCITDSICVANQINNDQFHSAINHCQSFICKDDNDDDTTSKPPSEERDRSRNRSWWNKKPEPTPRPTDWPS